MPAGFAALIEVLCDPAMNVDALTYVEQCAVGIEKSVNAAAARQRIQRLARLREDGVLDCLGHRAMVSGSLCGAGTVRILSPLIEPDRRHSKPPKRLNRSFCQRRDKVPTQLAWVGSDHDAQQAGVEVKRDEGIC